ncbi:CotS family spore coat protein [Clostridium rectalis]|uniref:CotS family spore coat protein n=1 Tax=Clostridium rectalis TaxID=2040295 RepID=UPI000F6315FB|nr:CotS family spore coat protein [Clostridium rectalis]
MSYAAQKYSADIFSEENIKKCVLPYYGLETAIVTQIKFKDTDKQRAVYRIDDTNNSYCLKKVYFSKEELLFVYSSIEWFYRNNIKVPRILPTLDGGRFVNYNDMLFILTPWIDGSKCNYDIKENILSSSENLAKMHNCSEKFHSIKGSLVRKSFDNINASTCKHFNHLLKYSNSAFKYKDKFSKLFLQHFDTNISMAQTVSSISNNIKTDNLSKSLCHLDYVNKNIILDTNNNIWVIDFDKCRIDYCVHDISYFMRRFMKRTGTNWDFSLAIDCLNSYEKFRSLNLDEYKYILVYLGFPQKYWKISRDYYKNIRKCNKNSFVKLLNKAIENDTYQYEFLYQFINYIENKFNAKLY